jgi:hypothetical protein
MWFLNPLQSAYRGNAQPQTTLIKSFAPSLRAIILPPILAKQEYVPSYGQGGVKVATKQECRGRQPEAFARGVLATLLLSHRL